MSDEPTITPQDGMTDEPARTYRGYRLKGGEFTTAMVHLCRGEVSRANVWRQRLDSTTNWAVLSSWARRYPLRWATEPGTTASLSSTCCSSRCSCSSKRGAIGITSSLPHRFDWGRRISSPPCLSCPSAQRPTGPSLWREPVAPLFRCLDVGISGAVLSAQLHVDLRCAGHGLGGQIR
jgi:Predicted integral membrane protein (DUF2270)